jgi:aspartate dehydrogenase
LPRLPSKPLRLGIIGFGGVARVVAAEAEAASFGRLVLSGILTRPRVDNPTAAPMTTALDAFLATAPDLVAECAGHRAVVEFGPAILRRGIDLIVISIGSLADEALETSLREAAIAGGARLIFSAGAIGGIDALAAAKLAGLTSVRYRSRKPPLAWRGTPAEQLVDLAGLREATVFYRGSAREAALQYPQNANVAATIALAGLGFERTEVEMIADPAAAGNAHELDVEGAAGSFSVRLVGHPMPDNPKTSALTAYSVLRAVLNEILPVVL